MEQRSTSQKVDDICVRMDQLANLRAVWESVWADIATYVLPDHMRFQPGSSSNPAYDQLALQPSSTERGGKRFDDTAVRACDRLASGIESLVTPQSAYWHELELSDPLAEEPTHEEKIYFERYRKYMFKVRYNAMAGFLGAHQKALRSAIALGTGVVYVEENKDFAHRSAPALYRHIPLSGCYLAVNAQGNCDTLYRRFQMSSRQMIQKFGAANVADAVRRDAERASSKDTTYTVIHAVQPRKESGGYPSNSVMGASYSSCYIDRTNQHLIEESGFFEFPYVVYYWQPVEEDLPYAQSPVMMALSDIKGLNSIRKVSLRALHQFLNPPIGIAHDGIMNKPNLNPGKTNMGAVTVDGRMKIQPIITAQNPNFSQEIITWERDGINDSLYIKLFQILLQNPGMTATEALIRANEKGELLGPAGGRIQTAMAQECEILGGIMHRRGVTARGMPLETPASLAGKDFGPKWTSPLDRLRRAAEGLGIQHVLDVVLPLAQVDPEMLDGFDLDEIGRLMTEIQGAPESIRLSDDARDAKRNARRQQQQMAQAAALAKTGGDAAKNIVPAIAQSQQLAGLSSSLAKQPATGAPPQ